MHSKDVTVKAEKTFRISLKIQAPISIDAVHITPREVQQTFRQFLRQHPHILVRIFETLENTHAHRQPSPQLPCVTKEQRKAILASK